MILQELSGFHISGVIYFCLSFASYPDISVPMPRPLLARMIFCLEIYHNVGMVSDLSIRVALFLL